MNVTTLTEDFATQVGQADVTLWLQRLGEVESSSSKYRRDVRDKMKQLKALVAPPSTVPTLTTSSANSSNSDLVSSDRRRKIATAEARSKKTLLKQNLEQLVSEFTEHYVWEDADDVDVENAMHSVKDWKKTFSDCSKEVAELEALIVCNELDEMVEDFNRLKLFVKKTSTDLEETVKNV